jgi:Flp pilus assembly protein TadG
MTGARERTSPRLRGDDGAALIEAVFVLPVMILIVFGVAELGFIFRAASLASASTRSGARLASATYAVASNKLTAADQVRQTVEEELSTKGTTDTPIDLWIYQADATGSPMTDVNFSSCPTNCLKYSWNGTTFVYSSGTWANPDACGVVLDRIGVFLRMQHNGVTGIVPMNRVLRQWTVMRLEPKPFGTCTSE